MASNVGHLLLELENSTYMCFTKIEFSVTLYMEIGVVTKLLKSQF